MLRRIGPITLLAILLPAVEPDPLLTALQKKIEGLGSLTGRFVQRVEAASLGGARVEEGRFAFRKPALMRWDYEKPEPKLALADGRSTWFYLPGDRQVHRTRVKDLGQESAAALMLSGRISLLKDFTSRRLAAEESGPTGVAGGVSFELTPRRRGGDLQRLVVVVDPVRLQIRGLTVVDPAGDRMIFELFDLEENPELPETIFRFEVPDGVEVLDEE